MGRTDRALVLARGLGSRMRADDASVHLTPEQDQAADAGLKALMPIGGRPFLDYVLASLADAGIRTVGLVIAPGENPLRTYYASAPTRVAIDFLIQADARGTADAVLAAEAWAGDAPFLTLNADNLYPTASLRALVDLDEPGLPVFDRDELLASSNIPPDRVQSFALVEKNADGYLTRIVEKPSPAEMPPPGQPMRVSMNCWRFDARIFPACRDVAPSPRGELELPLAVMLAVSRGVPFRAVPAKGPVLDLSRRGDTPEVARRVLELHLEP
ncbi:MAG: sugar phosphate nucleotidyltransferase [Vicinamibacterales bacterium]